MESLHCVYYKYPAKYVGKFPWTARIGNATGTFATVGDLKKWAKAYAAKAGWPVTFEKL